MPNDQLWAPWRLAFIKGDDRPRAVDPSTLKLLPGADPACFLCRAVAGQGEPADRENLLVHRGSHAVVVLNRYPYNNGHLLVAPALHKARLDQLTADEHLDVQQLIARLILILEQAMNAEGFNVGLNLGRVAGAGLPGHVHWHVVPRWNGDTNFMSVLGGVDVIPQSLDALWQLLRAALAGAATGPPAPPPYKPSPAPPATSAR